MAKCKLLAFLLCENATRDRDGKVTLHGVFDKIIVPKKGALPKLFFVYYKVFVLEPCTVSLRVTNPSGQLILGNWTDALPQVGPMQAIWALITTPFERPGLYDLELRQQIDDTEALPLANTQLVVDQMSE